VVTDRAPALRAAIDELLPSAFHNMELYENNRVECDHGRLKARLRPMRGLKRDHSARVVMGGHVFLQNVRRGHYELGIHARAHRRVAHAFTELAQVILRETGRSSDLRGQTQLNATEPSSVP
jgi:transposase-like protein